jgi:hypothetical protein
MGAALLVAPGLARAQILDLVYERTVMIAADGRCGLFSPEISAALAAGRAQARGVALRSGASGQAVASVERRAAAVAGATPCGSPAFAIAAERVREAFSGYARLERLDYPGDVAAWRADRSGAGVVRWRLAQRSRFGADRMIFGLAGRGPGGALIALAEFDGERAPYAARLLMRDPQRSGAPYLDRLGAGAASASGLPLSRRLPPRSALTAYAAEARSPAGSDLAPKGWSDAWAFRFPARAVSQLAALDPREAVAVEFLFPGDETRTAFVEVGDFAAGQAFVALPQR